MGQGLLALFTTLLGAMLIPLALASGTAWLLLPGHLVFSILCCLGPILAALGGRSWRARTYGLGYLALSIALVIALAIGSEVREGSWYWILPWAGGLLWAWIPPVIATGSAWVADLRRAQRTASVVSRRRKARRRASGQVAGP
ncbi:MAG: hypothetical protein EA397_11550 [Deltaproteobacteria bacterium]|nr:MAG: hypothetical protein EA397_11550 [Deltaproteobacteria bacterium]